MIPWLRPGDPFPPLAAARREPNGLLAAGADLSPPRLLAAYRSGIFPWYADGQPILWWSPDPRTVLPPAGFHVSRSLRRLLRRALFTVSGDRAFAAVVAACADTPRAGQDGTWIVSAMREAYLALHELGHAHSVEVWRDGNLAGGVYGVAMGRMFFAESMFSLQANASKVALAHLCRALATNGFALIDCQMPTPHLHALGAVDIGRDAYRAALDRHYGETATWPADWTFANW